MALDAARGTGALGDLGCYLIDQARWYVGDIARVSTNLRNTINRPHAAGDAYQPPNDSAILGVLWEGVEPNSPCMVGQVHSVGDRAFIDAILNDEPITPSFYDGWKVQQVIETAFAANTSCSWESVPEDES